MVIPSFNKYDCNPYGRYRLGSNPLDGEEMAKENGMSYEELLTELKTMKRQIDHYRKLTQEMHRLDAEYWYIQNMDRKGMLPTLELIANASSSNN